MAFSKFLVGFGSAFAFVVALKIACIGLPANQFAFNYTTSLGALGGVVGNTSLTGLVNY
ncbi:hypothetical protein [Candidatus Coxiella mudrowiae]|uniref:hypothetical protein n=1 Tax=Candidatus Coxiella mudrowiae TaxID=2054173 RepID=UPI001FD35042|nr:hypothetical protein [Candidatus Coxiella mudrowiae]